MRQNLYPLFLVMISALFCSASYAGFSDRVDFVITNNTNKTCHISKNITHGIQLKQKNPELAPGKQFYLKVGKLFYYHPSFTIECECDGEIIPIAVEVRRGYLSNGMVYITEDKSFGHSEHYMSVENDQRPNYVLLQDDSWENYFVGCNLESR